MKNELMIKIETINNGYILKVFDQEGREAHVVHHCSTALDAGNFLNNYLLNKAPQPKNEIF